MITFDDFLRTGRFGPIATGMTRDAVRHLLGDPADTSLSKHPEIWKFGPLELAFYRPQKGAEPLLTSITYQAADPDVHQVPLAFSGWLPTAGTSYAACRAHLDEAGIAVFGGVTSPPRQHLVLGSAVRMTFDESLLVAVGYTAKAKSEVKQVSISVPQDDWHALSREAESRGITASALCTLWINEHVSGLRTHQEA